MAKLIETFQEGAIERVDAEKGVLFGVKLLGEHSANGRRYMPEAMKRAVPLYNGRKGYANHPTKREQNDDRKLQDWTTVFENARYVEGSGIHGDAHLLKSDPLFPKIIEAAQRFPKSIGFSHVADGDTKRINGVEVVESIKEVFSVDLVSDPATTNGFFESKNPAATSLQEFIDAIPDSIPDAKRVKLVEAISDAWPMMGNTPADPQQQIMSAFQSMLNVVLEVLRSTMDANNQAAQTTAQAQADAAKQAAEEAKAKSAQAAQGGQQPPAPTLESLQRKLDLMEAENMLRKSGRAAADEKVLALQIETLADSKAEKRNALLESWPKVGEQKKPIHESRAFERPGQSPPANGSGNGNTPSALDRVLEARRETLKEGKIRQCI